MDVAKCIPTYRVYRLCDMPSAGKHGRILYVLVYRYFPNGAEVDIMIPEDFRKEDLIQFMDDFAKVHTGTVWQQYT